jgi:hypothetical protein
MNGVLDVLVDIFNSEASKRRWLMDLGILWVA